MTESFEANSEETEKGFDPMYYMRTLAEKVMSEHGGDEKKAQSLVADILSQKGLDQAFLLHRLDPEKQQHELLGILDDPTNEEEIALLFNWDVIPDELKAHYELT